MAGIFSIFSKYSGKLLAIIATIVTFVSYAIPDSRSWVNKHGLIILVISLGYVLLMSVYFNYMIYSHRKPLRDQKDLQLVKKRLGDWSMEGDFYLYLRTQANHDRFPFKYLEQLISRVESWNHDTLPLHNRKLKNAFKPLRVAVETYQTTLLSETYTMGSGPYPAQEYNENFVQVAPEWVSEDPTRYKVAYKNLNDQRIALVEALETIFTVVHELEASGSDSH